MKKNIFQYPILVSIVLILTSMQILKVTSQDPKLSLEDKSLVKVLKAENEWKKHLTTNQFYILRQKGTETPFKNAYHNNHQKGHYFCAGCGLPLFSSKTKFESGTGWPSFYAPIDKKNVTQGIDNSHRMQRGEITCTRCGGHLGHVFDDGPSPTGLRYCMNSGALVFLKK
ncbi:MAG: peptide-methionine (R)-S-oxide reductase [Cytophagaceae bacterium BCCC1]|nr:MAG: peptide-methionine (R)-S-oxide reductase [Cytophagaceae bacterium BCCC1]